MPLFPPDVHAYACPTRNVAGPTVLPGEEAPDVSGPIRFLGWLLGRQTGLIAVTVALGVLWFLPGALNPYLMGRAVDAGILDNDAKATAAWASAMLLTSLVGAISDAAGHTTSVAGWLVAMFRSTKLVARKVTQMGHVLTRRVPTGEMLSVASSDSDTFGMFAEAVGRAIAALLSFLFVAALVLSESLRLGLVVLIGAPLLVMAAAPLLRPLQAAQAIERERSSKLTGMATDIVAGLRILRGIGGERTFGDNYARQSQLVRRAGVRAGTWWSGVDATSVLLSGLLLVVLTWMGAREMMAGRLTVGQLISFFGYAVFLVRPIQTFFEAAQKWSQATVSAKKTIGVLAQQPPWIVPEEVLPLTSGRIRDEATGFTADPGELTIIVSALPDESAALADRIGRYLPTETQPVAAASAEVATRAQGPRRTPS